MQTGRHTTAIPPSWGSPPPGSLASRASAPRRPQSASAAERSLISPIGGPLQLHLDHRKYIAGAMPAAQRGEALRVERLGGIVDRVAQRRRQLVEYRHQLAQQVVAIIHYRPQAKPGRRFAGSDTSARTTPAAVTASANPSTTAAGRTPVISDQLAATTRIGSTPKASQK